MSIRHFIVAVFLATGLTNLSGAPDARPDVAKIVTREEATNILGEAVRDPTPRSGEGADGYYSKCNYYSIPRGKSLVIRLQLPGPNAIDPAKELQLMAAANGSMEDVAGIGDAAKMSTAGGESGFASRILMLYVAKGNAFLTVGVSGFSNDAIALEKAKTVVQKLLEHL